MPVMSSARPAIFFCLIMSTTTPHASRACSCPTKPTPQAQGLRKKTVWLTACNLLCIPLPWAVCSLLQLAHHSLELNAVSATQRDVQKLRLAHFFIMLTTNDALPVNRSCACMVMHYSL